jgi:hypothetical protein
VRDRRVVEKPGSAADHLGLDVECHSEQREGGRGQDLRRDAKMVRRGKSEDGPGM